MSPHTPDRVGNLPAGYTPEDTRRYVAENHHNRHRSHFERDRARVLHSSALRRLAAKTQVVAPTTDDFVRNRLTHSLEVAQIGRELGKALGCDPDVVDAACLSHDLGHPPFGHNGETALAGLTQHIGGFEGNAQTLRLLVRLEPKIVTAQGCPAGLNLTRAALDAACKYPWSAENAPPRPDGRSNRKFGVYRDDLAVFEWLRAGAPDRRTCLEAQVMDLSDDISYSVHDVEDAIASGALQLGVLGDPAQRERVIEWTQNWYLPDAGAQELDAALRRLEDSPVWVPAMAGTRRDLARLKNMTSQFIGRFAMSAVEATRAVAGDGPLTRYGAQLVVPWSTELEISVLKGIATAFVMTVRDAQPLYENQKEILTILVDALMETDGRFLSPEFAADWRELGDGPGTEAARLRLVVDQIACLTDLSAVTLHDRIRGTNWRTGDKPLW